MSLLVPKTPQVPAETTRDCNFKSRRQTRPGRGRVQGCSPSQGAEAAAGREGWEAGQSPPRRLRQAQGRGIGGRPRPRAESSGFLKVGEKMVMKGDVKV